MEDLALGVPAPSEYAPYYGRYIERVPGPDVLGTLESQRAVTLALLGTIPEERGHHRYAAGKWSIKEVLGHIIDVERVFATRALAFARKDPQPLPGIEQDDYVRAGEFDTVPLSRLTAEFDHLRRSNLLLFQSFDAETGRRRGIASGFEFSTRAVPWILAGHELHHVDVLRERYLS